MRHTKAFVLGGLLLLSGPSVAQQATDFLQGPEQKGHTQQGQGRVIGKHQDLGQTCYIILADQAGSLVEGLGGGGRFFLCMDKDTLKMRQMWRGEMEQTDTRMLRVGPQLRVTPVFKPKKP